jgi:hypothetical protein
MDSKKRGLVGCDYGCKKKQKIIGEFKDSSAINVITSDDVEYKMPYAIIKKFDLFDLLATSYGKVELNRDSKDFTGAIAEICGIGPEDIVVTNEKLEYFGFRHNLLINDRIFEMFETISEFFQYINGTRDTNNFYMQEIGLIDEYIYNEQFRPAIKNSNVGIRIENSIVRDIKKIIECVVDKHFTQFYYYLKKTYKTFEFEMVNLYETYENSIDNGDAIKYFEEKKVDLSRVTDNFKKMFLFSNITFFKEMDRFKVENKGTCPCSEIVCEPENLFSLNYLNFDPNIDYKFKVPLFKISSEVIICEPCNNTRFKRFPRKFSDFDNIYLFMSFIK